MVTVMRLHMLCSCGEKLEVRRQLRPDEVPPERVRVVCPSCEKVIDARVLPDPDGD